MSKLNRVAAPAALALLLAAAPACGGDQTQPQSPDNASEATTAPPPAETAPPATSGATPAASSTTPAPASS